MSTDQHRDPICDVLRGLAMGIVVLGHALIGVDAALESQRMSRFLILLIYTTHMPVFFLLAGYFSRRLIRSTWRLFLRASWQRIVWPYLLWSFVLLLAHHLASEFTNTRVEQFRPLTILWKPPAIMWFLYVLGLSTLAARLLAPLGPRVLAAVGLTFVAVSYGLEFPFAQLRFIGLFLLGGLLSRAAVGAFSSGLGLRLAIVVFLAIGGLAWWQAATPFQSYPAAEVYFLPALVAGPVLLWALSEKISAGSGIVSQICRSLGRHSMAVFLVHIFVIAAARILLMALGLKDDVALVLLVTLCGLTVPVVCSRWAEAWGLSRFLGWRSAGLPAGKQAQRKKAAFDQPAREQRG